jgi:flagellar hook-length control protein FliK
MAFGTMDRVETAAWRSQARRTADTPRASDATRPRFDEALSKAEAAKTGTTAASDRKDDGPGTRADTPKQDGARTTRDAQAPSRDRADAADRATKAQGKDHDKGTGKDKDKAEDGAVQSGSGKTDQGTADQAGSSDKAAKTAQAREATGEPATPLMPAVAPVTPQAQAQPAPATAGQATAPADGDGGTQAASAIPTGGVRGGGGTATPAVPAGEVEAETETGEASTTARTEADSKDFLAALSDTGSGPAPAPDAAGATPSAPGQTTSPGAVTGTAGTTHAAAATPTAPAIPLGQVPMTIGLRSLAGSSEFQIRLDPIELGRIDVKLEIDKAKGTVATHLTVDRPDTLALLQRDAGQLQQALTQAGLDPTAGGVSLSLRSDSGNQAGGQGGQPGGDGRPNTPWSADRADTLQDAVPVQRLRGYGGLDIRI